MSFQRHLDKNIKFRMFLKNICRIAPGDAEDASVLKQIVALTMEDPHRPLLLTHTSHHLPRVREVQDGRTLSIHTSHVLKLQTRDISHKQREEQSRMSSHATPMSAVKSECHFRSSSQT